MEGGKPRLAISSLVFAFKKLLPLFYFFHDTSLYFTTKCAMVLPLPSPSPPLNDRNQTFTAAKQNRSRGPWCLPRLRGLRRAGGGSGRAPSVVRWKSPCSCRPTAAISAMFLLKISTSFALNLARGRVKQKIQLEGSGGGSLSLHGWALNTCNSDASVSCGSESCFLFVAPQMLHLWEKNKNSFPLEWLSGKRLQRWEEYTCHDSC